MMSEAVAMSKEERLGGAGAADVVCLTLARTKEEH